MRSIVAALVIWIYLRKPKPSWQPAQWGSIISYAFTVVLFVWATKLTTAANAIFLQYTAPIWVVVFGTLITKERVTKLDVITVIVVMCGMLVFFINRVDPGAETGNFIALLSGVAFAGVALFMRAQRGISTTESILFGNVLAAVMCVPFFKSFVVDVGTISGILFLGVLQLGVSYILYSWAIKHVSAIEAILLTTLEPILNPIWVTMFYGETPSLISIIGGIIVVGGVVAREILGARNQLNQAR